MNKLFLTLITAVGITTAFANTSIVADLSKADADHIYFTPDPEGKFTRDDYNKNPSAYEKGWQDGWHYMECQNLVAMTHTDIEVYSGYKSIELYGKPDLTAKVTTLAMLERGCKVEGFQDAVEIYLKARRPERSK